jgi:MerR family transcriptional regulator, mercuric resistance operon regulatory protein
MGFDLNNNTKLTIGRLARESGLSITTVRYYQQRGLLRRPERPATGSFRSYGESDLERLKLIKQAQEFGFTLAEISELIVFIQDGNCREVRALTDKKLQAIKAQIKLLENTRKALSALLGHCDDDCDGHCALIQKLRSSSPISGGHGKSRKPRP